MDEPEVPMDITSDVTPLRAVLAEIHEIYEELRYVGFSSSAANDIVAHLVVSVVHSRNDDSEEYELVTDDEEDTDDDDYDGAR